MAERSSPAVRALVRTSWTFPATTARTLTTGDVPTFDAEAEASTSSAVILTAGPLLVPSTTQTPTPVSAWNTVPIPESRNADGAAGAGLTTTVMPSASTVANGGTTRVS